MIWAEYNRELGRNRMRRVFRVCSWLALFAILAGAGYAVGRYYGDLDRRYLDALTDMRGSLERELESLRREQVNLNIEKSVGVQSGNALRDSIKALHDEQAQLRQELVFYRSLMAPDKLSRGLQVASFELFAQDSENFTYHLLLTQVTDQRARISGSVEIAVVGKRAGETQVLPLTDLMETQRYPLTYRFRYFQDLKGELRLPSSFEPLEVQVSVTGRDAKKREHRFAWADALAAGGG